MALLATQKNVRTSLFVKVDIPSYGTIASSDHFKPYTVAGQLYDNISDLLEVSESASQLRASEQEMIISFSGIDSATLTDLRQSELKGSPVTVTRVYFDDITGELLAVDDNILVKFKGIVNNVGFSESINPSAATSTFTVALMCTSEVSILLRKVAGRRTNPADEAKYFPNDLSMTRVPTIKNSNFQFGAKPTGV